MFAQFREPLSLRGRALVSAVDEWENGSDLLSPESSSAAANTSLSVCQYNILADNAIPRGDSGHDICGSYNYCPNECKPMSNRHPRMMSELRTMSPGILTVQEVESEHYYKSLAPDMRSLGYESAAHLRWFDHIGLAIFYDTDKFDLLDQYAFIMNKKVDDVFSGYGVSPATMAAIAEHMERSSAFEDIISPPGCLMVRLRHKSTGRQICVSNVHVTWKEFKCPVLQLLQVICTLEETVRFAAGCPIILAGDFNFAPSTSGYKLLCESRLSNKDLQEIINNNFYLDGCFLERNKELFDFLEQYCCPIELQSSYGTIMGREPSVTTCDLSGSPVSHLDLCAVCLDYIWYAKASFRPERVLDTPEIHLVTEHTALPSVIYPSDHLPLYAELTIQEH